MTERWVANASPLILLGKAGQADLLTQLPQEVIIPTRVVQEVRVKPEGVDVLAEILKAANSREAEPLVVPHDIEAWDLGRGESQVLATALSVEGRAVLDDLEARRCAEALGVPVIGTLGVVLRARRKQLIPAARPVFDALRNAGLYISNQLAEQALAHVGE